MSYYKNRFKPLTSEPPLDPPEDTEEEEEEVDPEDAFDFEAWEEEQYERAIEADSQRHLDWLYNTRGL